jgi:8-oxo-dGTP diphosphatase
MANKQLLRASSPPGRIVTAAIIRTGEKVLIARRGPAMDLAGFWEFPGGKVEKNESPEQSLKRELLEELAIEAEIGRLVCFSDYTYAHGSFRILAFESFVLSGCPVPLEHDRLEFVHPSEFPFYNFLPADIPIYEYIATNSQ